MGYQNPIAQKRGSQQTEPSERGLFGMQASKQGHSSCCGTLGSTVRLDLGMLQKLETRTNSCCYPERPQLGQCLTGALPPFASRTLQEAANKEKVKFTDPSSLMVYRHKILPRC